ncbi:MAG: hypothetical protein QOH76_2706 [Thermoleophilaceae bacterium]|jgi:hypothetical protein|nr:hypothetical protein [Thermoleophilaceae bacterium]
MSFFVDPVLLFADGELYARTMPESAQGGAAKVVGGVTVGAVLAAGIGSYLDASWAKALWKPFGAKNGTAFMVAWPFAHGKRRRRSPRTDAVAAVLFPAYPLFWWLGWDHGRRRRPRASS